MIRQDPSSTPTESRQREQLATYFLTAPPLEEQTPEMRREYREKLHQLGQLECQDILDNAGLPRPLVWGNPAPLLQALLCAMQKLGARLGQPLSLFPAHTTSIGRGTLFHPRILAVAVTAAVTAACRAAPRETVRVRLQEHSGGLVVSITATAPFLDDETAALIQECTRLHDGRLVHHENTVLFTCGPACDPPANIRLYGCPTEEELLQDALSPVWSLFYASVYSALACPSSSGEDVTNSAMMYASEEANSAAASASTADGLDS